jgi:hemin uptake protein HemP
LHLRIIRIYNGGMSCQPLSLGDAQPATSDQHADTRGAERTNGPIASHGAGAAAIDSRELMAGGRERLIRHEQTIYRLRVTAQGKLILTK